MLRVSVIILVGFTGFLVCVLVNSLLAVGAEKGIFEIEANPTGNLIGGGKGYSRIVAPKKADYVVNNKSELLNALKRAYAGEVIYVADDAEIDLTGEVGIDIAEGAVLASGRGRVLADGAISSGALLYTNKLNTRPLLDAGINVRVTGLRLRGPYQDTGGTDVSDGIAASKQRGVLEVDNCELYGWGHAAVFLYRCEDKGYIHHNYIHHNQRSGYGYGVSLWNATSLIEANLFDYNRHSIAATGKPASGAYPTDGYEARYNIILEHATSHAFDMHGGGDHPPDSPKHKLPAGGEIRIHHNIFRLEEMPVHIRGIPETGCWIHHNWIYNNTRKPDWEHPTPIIKQKLRPSSLYGDRAHVRAVKDYQKIYVHDNHYGPEPPPKPSTEI